MENEQMNQQPTFEQVAQAYTTAVRENELLKSEINSIRMDRSLQQLQTVMHVLEHKDYYSKEILKLAEWHVKKMLAKPKK